MTFPDPQLPDEVRSDSGAIVYDLTDPAVIAGDALLGAYPSIAACYRLTPPVTCKDYPAAADITYGYKGPADSTITSTLPSWITKGTSA